MKENIALIGFMGSGKSTIGKQLAKVLEMKFIDIDKEIESKEGRSIPEIFDTEGEAYFRNLERETIKEQSRENNIIISTGGGSIVDNQNVKSLIGSSFVVYLDCTVECIYNRVKRRKNRPLLNVENILEKIEELLSKRERLYRISADYIVSIDDDSTIYESVSDIKKAYIES